MIAHNMSQNRNILS